MSGARRRLRRAAPGAAMLAASLVAWELWARAQGAPSLFLPAPSRVAARLVELLRHGDLAADVVASLRRLALGFAWGGGPALALGLAMGWSRAVRRLADPWVAALHPLPKVAVLPLVLLVFGIGEASKVVLAAIGAFFPLVINTMAGVRAIHPVHFEVAKSCGASRGLVLRHIVLPGSLPTILAGTRLALNAALLMVLVAELLAAEDGLGERIWFAWQTLRVEELYATLVVIALLGLGLQSLLSLAGRLAMPWRAEASEESAER